MPFIPFLSYVMNVKAGLCHVLREIMSQVMLVLILYTTCFFFHLYQNMGPTKKFDIVHFFIFDKIKT